MFGNCPVIFVLLGYQRELTYKHDDGSFSAFGKSDPSGSVWLTSFVAKSFTGAAKFITIDTKVIEMAVTFIIAQQERSGTFREPGRIVDSGIEVRTDSILLTFSFFVLLRRSLWYYKLLERHEPNFVVTFIKSSW